MIQLPGQFGFQPNQGMVNVAPNPQTSQAPQQSPQQNTQGLDPSVVNLTKAIRQEESGGNFQAKGKSGEYGAYQWMPNTWTADSQKYLGQSVPFGTATPEQQNEVAYKKIAAWKAAGYNVGQIASMWNAGGGNPNAYLSGNKGTNAQGASYDTSAYAKNVATIYQQLKAQSNSTNIPGIGSLPGPSSQNSTSTPAQTPAQSTNTSDPLLTALGLTDNSYAPIPVLRDVTNDITKTVGDIGQQFQNMQSGQQGGASTGFQNVGSVAGLGVNVVGDVLKGIPGFIQAGQGAGWLFNAGKSILDSGISALTGKDTEAIQNMNSQATQGFLNLHPELRDNLTALGKLVQAGTLVSSEPQATEMGEQGAKNLTQALTERYSTQNASDFENLADINGKAGDVYNNASSQGTNLGQVLAKNGLKVSDITDGKIIDSEATADSLRTNAGQASKTLLRPALIKADSVGDIPLTSVDDIVNKTISNVKNSPGITPGNVETQIAKITKEGESLARQYPNGMSLTDMHDNKITYAQNGKYSPVNDPIVNNTANVNRAFGRTLGGLVEQNAPVDIPVHEFNAALQKQYQAADFLDSLDGKKIPTTFGSVVRNTLGKLGGLAIASHTFGSGVLADVAGYRLGGLIESTLETMSNPLKNYFLNNLLTEDPQVFGQINNYLKYAPGQKLLPAPSLNFPNEVNNVPIEMPAKIHPLESGGAGVRSTIIHPRYIPSGGPITQIFGQP